ncbi:C_GCAxxG_C_C family protein [Desulfatibacillum aliphaticivorans]|uniref:C_GCAxxG_C_C family protein n=1 Tax=Desulfatibacillum aliphaticivorans TaxID=218208 RepID=B8FDL6_DESAL|nr:C-GCAxxG-C-C family protein [Desulfatibacillum aliphaticivorans]ACL06647.1 C_GCAxxG_C_C family protein [Desulfatibacillum aliphaticivorans]
MTDWEKQATEFFDNGFNCAQGVLIMQSETLGLDKETAARIASAFGGGVSRTGNVCGAVAGALMALGMQFGNQAPNDKVARERAYDKADQFIARFTESCGSIICRDLLGLDLSQPGILEKAREENIFHDKCPRYVALAAEIAEAMLAEGK